MDKPDVDHIEGLSPAISIDQKSSSKDPRSTVGTVTEIYDYLRILFARAGIPYCINGHGPIQRQSTDQIVDIAQSLPEGTRLQVLAPIIRGRKGEYKKDLQEVAKAGYVRVRVDGTMYEVTDDIPMDRYKQHTIEVVVDRLVVKEGIERRLSDSIESALKMGSGLVQMSMEFPADAIVPEVVLALAAQQKDESVESSAVELLFSESYSCPVCGYSLPELEPRLFSFNSPYGACPDCTGLGTKTEFDPALIAPDHTKILRDGAILPFVYKSGEVKDWWPEMLDAVGKVVGFDAGTQSVADLKAGDVQGLIVQNPMQMGYLGVKTVVAKIRNQPVEAKVDTGITLVTPANQNDPEVLELLHPPLSKYLAD
jgi:excinuclease ABC subunit A